MEPPDIPGSSLLPPSLCLYYFSTSNHPLDEDKSEVYPLEAIKEFPEINEEDNLRWIRESAVKGSTRFIIPDFFSRLTAYEVIPSSSKLLVFDTALGVKKAFYALVYNGVRAAPLWNSLSQNFVGMLTISDFIQVLHMTYNSPDRSLKELEEHRLETWRELLPELKSLIYIRPSASLYEAVRMLISNQIHRLPVIDRATNNVLCILTHKRLLRYLFKYMSDLPRPRALSKSISKLSIGTYTGIQTATYDTPVIQALDTFMSKRISALPIVDAQGKLIDIYAKFDVINLAAEKSYENLDMSLKEASAYRNEWFKGVHKCLPVDTLLEVIEKIVQAEVHRLVVVEEDDTVVGVISLSDILKFLVLTPRRDETEATD